MIREVKLKYTAYTLAKLSREVWGDNAVDYLSSRLESVITYDQLRVLIDSLENEIEDKESISWGELADLTHVTQVERFNFCTCEEQEDFPYADCPREESL
jgi:hypothetical protein